MKTLLLLTLVCGCAYGNPGPEITYGHTTGPSNDPDAGVDNLGVDPTSNLPYGCGRQYIPTPNGPVGFVVCNEDPLGKWKDLVDPPPDPVKKQ